VVEGHAPEEAAAVVVDGNPATQSHPEEAVVSQQARSPQAKVGGRTVLKRGLPLALVILGLGCCGPCLGDGGGPSLAGLQGVLPTGWDEPGESVWCGPASLR